MFHHHPIVVAAPLLLLLWVLLVEGSHIAALTRAKKI
jgi:hypothetical protein